MSIAHLQQILIHYLWFLIALSIHEWGHAVVAYWQGDNTPVVEGRLTLNPIAHMSFLGTLVIPLGMALFAPGVGVIGWARPVMINSNNFKHKKLGDVLCSLAGPALNFFLAFFVLLLGYFLQRYNPVWFHLMSIGAIVNVCLGVFNLLPIPPLDGSHLLKIVFRMSDETYVAFSEYSFWILLIAINTPVFRYFFSKTVLFCLYQIDSACTLIFG